MDSENERKSPKKQIQKNNIETSKKTVDTSTPAKNDIKAALMMKLKNKGTLKWMVYNGKSYWNGWFGGTPIFGNTHMYSIYL